MRQHNSKHKFKISCFIKISSWTSFIQNSLVLEPEELNIVAELMELNDFKLQKPSKFWITETITRPELKIQFGNPWNCHSWTLSTFDTFFKTRICEKELTRCIVKSMAKFIEVCWINSLINLDHFWKLDWCYRFVCTSPVQILNRDN